MKIATVLTLAAMIAAGSATQAGALLAAHGLQQAEALAAQSGSRIDRVVHDRCHGQSSGTAHPHCGTATGGPVGGLH